MELLGGSAFAMVVGVIVVVFFVAGVGRILFGLPQTAAVITSILVDLANGDRVSNSLSALKVNPVLVAAAQAKANDMAAKGYFAHVSPEGIDPWHWFKEAGYTFSHAGENLAVDFSDSSDVEKAWMNSPSHRENILDAKYTEIGIASAVGVYEGHETIFVVQEFGLPAQAGTPTPQGVPHTVVAQTVPTTPTIIATAEAPKPEATVPNAEPEQVLGTTNVEVSTSPPEAVVEASSLPAPMEYVIASPRTTLRYSFLTIGLFLLIALAYTTRFEMKKHHLRHVKAVTLLIVFMGVLFLAGNYFVFTEPVIASTGPSVTQGR